MSEPSIRPATTADASACQEIYRPYVTDTAITFEDQVPALADMQDRINQAHRWLIAEREGQIVGYAYATPFKARAAYDWSCEVSVYLQMGLRRSGIGRALYEALFGELSAAGFRRAIAAITLPNGPSVGLHNAFGFDAIGTQRAIGWKFDRWHDVLWCQRSLGRPGMLVDAPPGDRPSV